MMTNEKLQDIAIWAATCHKETNQMYDEHDYSYHLGLVVKFAIKYLPKDHPHYNEIIAACYCHDLIEDARQTYNDVLEFTGSKLVADISYALTNNKGKTRAERANDQYYIGIVEQEYAVFCKLCDRAGNTYYSNMTKSSMLGKYKKEYPHFIEMLDIHNQEDYVKDLNREILDMMGFDESILNFEHKESSNSEFNFELSEFLHTIMNDRMLRSFNTKLTLSYTNTDINNVFELHLTFDKEVVIVKYFKNNVLSEKTFNYISFKSNYGLYIKSIIGE